MKLANGSPPDLYSMTIKAIVHLEEHFPPEGYLHFKLALQSHGIELLVVLLSLLS